MKKALVAGAASAVLAAMPVLGVFADTTSQIDRFEVTLNKTCTMQTVSHTNGDGTWSSATGTGDDTLTATITAGSEVALGSTTFNIVCNAEAGWQVSAVATPLTGETNSAQSITLGASGATYWKFTPAKVDSNDNTFNVDSANQSPVAQQSSSGTIGNQGYVSGVTGDTGKSFTVSYAVKADTSLSAQKYTGNITYTLTGKTN